jgi:hypothetical protein
MSTVTTAATAVRTALLTGDTFRFKDILKSKGWRWDAENKGWTKAAEWDDEADVIYSVRSYGGIRNRGSFTAEFV